MLPIKPTSTMADYFNFKNLFFKSNNPALLLSSTGEILDCNNAFLKLYNLSSNQIITQSYFLICQEHHITPAFSSINQILDDPSKTAVSIISNGILSAKTIQWTASIIEDSEDIKNICIYGMDISAVVHESIMTKKIQDSIIDHLPSHFIFWKNTEGVYLGCNEAFAKSLGFKSPDEVIGKTDYDLPVKKEDSDAYRADDKEVMTSKKPKLNLEEPQTLANGDIRTLLTSKVPLTDEDNQVYGVLAIYSDITEMKKMSLSLQKALIAAEAASAAKTEFIRNMSHDLRTPLTGIIGMSGMLEHMSDAMVAKEGAQDIRQAGTALLNLLNEIIETAQLELGDIPHKKSCFSLKTTIDALTAIFKPAVTQKNLTLETYYDDNIPEILFGQELLLHRIILNLLGNAVKFTDNGSIGLEVSLSRKTSEKAILKIVVKDTGSGIPTNKQEVIFDKFSRLTSSYENNYKGSGLGLYMVKEFIKKLGGDIKVNSVPDNGAQFTCSVQFKIPTAQQIKKYQQHHESMQAMPIPRRQNEIDQFPKKTNTLKSKQPIEQHTITMATQKITEKLRVLLVEDNPLPRKIAQLLLSKEGYEVVTAETAKEAEEQASKNVFDLIYLDIGLPDGSGIDVARTIRQNANNPNINTYIVALTAHSDAGIRNECLDVGMQEIFDKPLSEEKIEMAASLMNQRLLKLIKRKEQQQEAQSEALPIIDLIAAIQLAGGNTEIAREMQAMFMAELPTCRTQITDAFKKERWEILKHHVHKLHGGLCYTGMPRLKSVTHTFEKQLNKQAGDYDEIYRMLMNEMDLVSEEYKKLINC